MSNPQNEKFEVLSAIKVSPDFSQYDDVVSDDQYGVQTTAMFGAELYEAYNNSEYSITYAEGKRVDQRDIREVFYHFKDIMLSSNKYTNVEIFIGICEFFEMSYILTYKALTTKDKELILEEMHATSNTAQKYMTSLTLF